MLSLISLVKSKLIVGIAKRFLRIRKTKLILLAKETERGFHLCNETTTTKVGDEVKSFYYLKLTSLTY